MKKTIAVIGSAAALSFAGAGLAAAEEADDQTQGADTTQTETTEEDLEDALDDVETPSEVSAIAEQLCGTISAYDFLGSAEGVVPGLSGEDCAANAQLAVDAAFSGDIQGAIDILQGIDAEVPDGDDADEDETDGDDSDVEDGAVDPEAGTEPAPGALE